MPIDAAKAFALFALQLELECIRIEHENRLVPFLCPNPDPPSRLLVVQFHDRMKVLFRDDVDHETVRRVGDSPLVDVPAAVERIPALTGTDVAWHGSTWVASTPLDGTMTIGVTERRSDEGPGDRSFVIRDGDDSLSGCSSSRENDTAAEAWVWTEERARRKGYGRQCVAAWANHMLRAGKVPFYSHVHDNDASRALATSLGLTWVFDACGFD